MRVQCIFYLSLLFFCWSRAGYAQNLVPNPSFEDTLYCPTTSTLIEAATGWQNFGQTPDFWHECGQGASHVPTLGFGYQYPHTGSGMAGEILYVKPNTPTGPNYREYIGIELKQPLVIGIKYFASFFINFSYNVNTALGCNRMGLRFSTVPYDSCCPPALNNWAHFYSDSILTDSVNWLKISGTIIADSSYNYLIIGNFFTDSLTDTVHLGIGPDNSYYYIDDICVSTDSNYCETWTGVEDFINEDTIRIYPNPTNTTLSFQSDVNILSYSIYDSIGRLTMQDYLTSSTNGYEIEVNQLENGVYILILNSINLSYKLKFLKI